MAATEVLERARDLLTEYGWTQRSHARNQWGEPCATMDPEARSFCTIGAMYRASVELSDRQGYLAATRKLHLSVNAAVPYWNDNSTRATVLKQLDECIGKKPHVVKEESPSQELALVA